MYVYLISISVNSGRVTSPREESLAPASFPLFSWLDVRSADATSSWVCVCVCVCVCEQTWKYNFALSRYFCGWTCEGQTQRPPGCVCVRARAWINMNIWMCICMYVCVCSWTYKGQTSGPFCLCVYVCVCIYIRRANMHNINTWMHIIFVYIAWWPCECPCVCLRA
jgi:hypothetical protein